MLPMHSIKVVGVPSALVGLKFRRHRKAVPCIHPASGFAPRQPNQPGVPSSNHMMEDSDAVAVAQAQAGDQDAFGMLVERHSIRLFQMVYRMTGNEQDAEDLVQETFLRAYKQLNRFEARAGFGTWLHRIAANCSLDLLRKRKRLEQRVEAVGSESEEPLSTFSSPAPLPDDQVFHSEVKQKVADVMEQLTPTERTAFVLRHYEGKSIEEIGLALGAGPSATKQSIFRAVQKMRRALEPVLNETP